METSRNQLDGQAELQKAFESMYSKGGVHLVHSCRGGSLNKTDPINQETSTGENAESHVIWRVVWEIGGLLRFFTENEHEAQRLYKVLSSGVIQFGEPQLIGTSWGRGPALPSSTEAIDQ